MRRNLIIIYVTAQFVILIPVDAHIDHDGSLFDIIRRDVLRPAERGDQNVRPAADLFEILRLRVRDRHRRVFLQHQKRHRFSDNIASPDDHAVLPGDLDAGAF